LKDKKEEKDIRLKKRPNLINISINIEPELLDELNEFIEKKFETINRTEFIRYAIHWCYQSKAFLEELKKLD